MVMSLVRRAFLAVILPVAMVSLLAVSAFCGCATCGGSDAVPGVDVNMTNGTTSVMPIVDFNMGPAAPARSDAKNMPGAGNVRNLGTPASPLIKWGTSRITTDSGSVLIDGVIAPHWSWSSTTNSLTTADGRIYAFDDSNGLLTRISGSDGLRVSTLAYDSQGHVTQAFDSYGNTWTYDVDTSVPGPTGVTDPDGIKHVAISYHNFGTYGEGQYKTVKIMYLGPNNQWVEQQSTDYSYDNLSRITSVVTSVPDYSEVTSTTNITYYPTDQAGLTQPVQRVENAKLNYDVTYSYSTESITTSGGVNTYGVVTQRRRATYSSTGTDTDVSDQVTKYYYYRDDNGKNTYIFRTVKQIYNGSAWIDYATTENRIYLSASDTRFSDAPAYNENLQGKAWMMIDARGNATSYAYNAANGRVSSITLPTGHYAQYWYNNNNQGPYVVKVRDARGKYTQYVRDANHPSLVTEAQVSDDGTNWTTIKQTLYYSTPSQKEGLVYQVTVPDIEGSDDMVTTYDYSEIIDLTTYYRPSPTKETYSWWNGTTYEDKSSTSSYYADGRLRWSKDALGNETDFSYDVQGRLVDTWLPADLSDTGTVESCDSATISDGTKSWLPGQLAGMAIEITAGDDMGSRYRIASNTGTDISVVGTLPDVTGLAYAVRPYNESHYMPCCGLIDEWRNERGNKTYVSYDDSGHVTEGRNDITGPSSSHPFIKYTYNDLGQKTEMITYKSSDDSTGRRTLYTYDQLGRLTKLVNPDSDGTRLLWDEYYQYDANGNLVAQLVGVVDETGNVTAGRVTAYKYDSLNRVTEVKNDYSASRWPIASILISSESVSYQYEGGSSLKTQMLDESGTSSYTYDTQGRVTSYSSPQPENYRVLYSYNAAGEKTSLVLQYNDSGWVNKYRMLYAYFKNGWLRQVKGQEWPGNWSDVTQSDYTYDEVGRCTALNSGSGLDVQSAYAYNARDDIKTIRHLNPARTVVDYELAYTRDGAGNPIAVDHSGDYCPPVYKGKRLIYAYDDAGRLTQQTLENGITSQWAYDWVGNRDPLSNVYNEADMLNKDVGYEYDYFGNVEYTPNNTAVPRARFYYDDDNLVSQVDDVTEDGTTSTTMTWDADKHRVKLQRGNRYWQFIYDPTVSNPSVLMSITDNGNMTFFFREPDGELLSSCSLNQVRYYNSDALGSNVMISDGRGLLVDYFAYDAWGKCLQTLSNSLPYQYVGGYGYYTHSSDQDAALANLMQLGVRLYDASTARFTQRDEANWNESFSSYAYVADNPLLYTDPGGLKAVKPTKAQRKMMKDCANTHESCLKCGLGGVTAATAFCHLACGGEPTCQASCAAVGKTAAAAVVAGCALYYANCIVVAMKGPSPPDCNNPYGWCPTPP